MSSPINDGEEEMVVYSVFMSFKANFTAYEGSHGRTQLFNYLRDPLDLYAEDCHSGWMYDSGTGEPRNLYFSSPLSLEQLKDKIVDAQVNIERLREIVTQGYEEDQIKEARIRELVEERMDNHARIRELEEERMDNHARIRELEEEQKNHQKKVDGLEDEIRQMSWKVGSSMQSIQDISQLTQRGQRQAQLSRENFIQEIKVLREKLENKSKSTAVNVKEHGKNVQADHNWLNSPRDEDPMNTETGNEEPLTSPNGTNMIQHFIIGTVSEKDSGDRNSPKTQSQNAQNENQAKLAEGKSMTPPQPQVQHLENHRLQLGPFQPQNQELQFQFNGVHDVVENSNHLDRFSSPSLRITSCPGNNHHEESPNDRIWAEHPASSKDAIHPVRQPKSIGQRFPSNFSREKENRDFEEARKSQVLLIPRLNLPTKHQPTKSPDQPENIPKKIPQSKEKKAEDLPNDYAKKSRKQNSKPTPQREPNQSPNSTAKRFVPPERR